MESKFINYNAPFAMEILTIVAVQCLAHIGFASIVLRRGVKLIQAVQFAEFESCI